MKLNKIYEGMLNSIGILVSTQGLPSLVNVRQADDISKGKNVSASIFRVDRRVQMPIVLATKEVLKLEENGTTVKFNPMAEAYIARGPSDIQNRLVIEASAAIATPLSVIALALIELALDTAKHESLSPAVFSLISELPVVKAQKTAENVQRYATKVLLKHTGIKGSNAMGRFKLMRDHVDDDGSVHARACRFSSPFLEKIMNDPKPANVAVPNKSALEVIQAAATVLSQQIFVISKSDSKTAPYFKSFAECLCEVENRINELSEMLGLDDTKGFSFDTTWAEGLGDLDKLYKKELNIRFEGNEGPLNGDIKAEAAATGAAPIGSQGVAISPAPEKKNVPVQIKPVNTEPVEEPEIIQEKKPMVLNSHASLLQHGNTSTDTDTASTYVSPIARASQGKTVPKQQAGSNVPASSGNVVIAEDPAPAPTRTSGNVVIAEEEPQMIHVTDANNEPLFMATGAPYLLAQSDIPNFPFVQKKNHMGHKEFSNSGIPVLKKATANGGQPQQYNPYNAQQQQQYGAPAQQYGTPADPYAALDAQRASKTLYGGHGTPSIYTHNQPQQYAPPQQYNQPPMPAVYDRFRRQIQPAFDHSGNATCEMYDMNGQPIRHISQLSAASAPVQPTLQVNGNYHR